MQTILEVAVQTILEVVVPTILKVVVQTILKVVVQTILEVVVQAMVMVAADGVTTSPLIAQGLVSYREWEKEMAAVIHFFHLQLPDLARHTD